MENRNLYILPTSDLGLKDRLFDKRPHQERGGVSNFSYWAKLKDACEKRGITVHTSDLWNREKSRPDDILLAQNHPGENIFWRIFYFLKYPLSGGGFVLARRRFFFRNYKFFKRRVLWQAESPVATPYVYKNIEKISKGGLYQRTFLLARPEGSKHSVINFYFMRDYNMTSVYFNDPKNKMLVMINSNAVPHSLGDEFYGERLRAIRYFSDKNVFDLYGYRWDKIPRHPFYFHYKKYVDRVWKGTVDDKLKTLSEYKFCLCFENSSYSGYISEKIFDCLAAGCIPVYLGAPDIESVVPASCFIDMRKFSAQGGSMPVRQAGASGGKNYDELYKHLLSLSEEDTQKYRDSILTFLRDKSNMKGPNPIVDEIIA